VIRRGRKLAPDKFFVEQQLAALVYLHKREHGGTVTDAQRAIALYLGTSEPTARRAWRDWGTGPQEAPNRSRAWAIDMELRISPLNYKRRISVLRRRLAEIRASRGKVAAEN
jgi:hypothetical protein